MLKLIPLLLMIPLMQTSVNAGPRIRQSGYSRDVKCYKDVYREEYIPGTRSRPGYVHRYTRKVEIPCNRSRIIQQYHQTNGNHVDDNSCIEGSVLGGIAGGGAGAVLSRGNGRWWAIPLGIVSGAMVGCQIDGG